MATLTPFDVNLQHDLSAERLWLINEWLFKWHSINITGKVVDVENFRGGRINVGGVLFCGSVRDVYWSTIGAHLSAKVRRIYERWHSETSAYPLPLRQSSLENTAFLLKSYAARVIDHARDTDRRLRGRGFPEKVPPYDASALYIQAQAEIEDLKTAHGQLLGEIDAETTKPVGLAKRVDVLIRAGRAWSPASVSSSRCSP